MSDTLIGGNFRLITTASKGYPKSCRVGERGSKLHQSSTLPFGGVLIKNVKKSKKKLSLLTSQFHENIFYQVVYNLNFPKACNIVFENNLLKDEGRGGRLNG